MPRTSANHTDILDLGRLITAAYGLDTSWHEDASCREYPAGKRVNGKTPWHYNINDEDFGEGVSAREMVKAAKMVCFGCPAQYDCAAYAAHGEMAAGTWAGLGMGELRWLQAQPEYIIDRIIADAGRRKIPMQEYVPMMMLQERGLNLDPSYY